MKLKDYLDKKGAVTKLALAIGVAPALVSQWKNGTRRVPAARCPSIERETCGEVRCEDVRPDVDWSCLRADFAKAVF